MQAKWLISSSHHPALKPAENCYPVVSSQEVVVWSTYRWSLVISLSREFYSTIPCSLLHSPALLLQCHLSQSSPHIPRSQAFKTTFEGCSWEMAKSCSLKKTKSFWSFKIELNMWTITEYNGSQQSTVSFLSSREKSRTRTDILLLFKEMTKEKAFLLLYNAGIF